MTNCQTVMKSWKNWVGDVEQRFLLNGLLLIIITNNSAINQQLIVYMLTAYMLII